MQSQGIWFDKSPDPLRCVFRQAVIVHPPYLVVSSATTFLNPLSPCAGELELKFNQNLACLKRPSIILRPFFHSSKLFCGSCHIISLQIELVGV